MPPDTQDTDYSLQSGTAVVIGSNSDVASFQDATSRLRFHAHSLPKTKARHKAGLS